jgi:hypothetical protein
MDPQPAAVACRHGRCPVSPNVARQHVADLRRAGSLRRRPAGCLTEVGPRAPFSRCCLTETWPRWPFSRRCLRATSGPGAPAPAASTCNGPPSGALWDALTAKHAVRSPRTGTTTGVCTRLPIPSPPRRLRGLGCRQSRLQKRGRPPADWGIISRKSAAITQPSRRGGGHLEVLMA